MKILSETPYFDLVKLDGKHGLHMKITGVAVLPYTVNDSGIVDQIGILKEWNQLRESGYAETLITGTIEPSDDDALSTAIRELAEEGGIDVSNEGPERWVFLGTLHDSKDTDRAFPTFAVNVTGATLGEAKPQNENEERSQFELRDVNEVIASSKEALVLAAFLRLFNIMYSKSFNNAK